MFQQRTASEVINYLDMPLAAFPAGVLHHVGGYIQVSDVRIACMAECDAGTRPDYMLVRSTGINRGELPGLSSTVGVEQFVGPNALISDVGIAVCIHRQ